MSTCLLEVANVVGETYPDGTWMVDLAPIQEEALVPQSVASALGLSPGAGRLSSPNGTEPLSPPPPEAPGLKRTF